MPKLGRLGSIFTAGSEEHSRRDYACYLLWSPGEILPTIRKQKEGAIVRRALGHRSSRQCEDGAAQRLICSHLHQACPTWFPLGQHLTSEALSRDAQPCSVEDQAAGQHPESTNALTGHTSNLRGKELEATLSIWT